jgi:putative hemolysin
MLINLEDHIKLPWLRHCYRTIKPLFENALGLNHLNQVYQNTANHFTSHTPINPVFTWFNQVLQETQVTYTTQSQPDFKFPTTGPLIVCANHPFGILDPCVIAQYISSHRNDVKVMGNSLLLQMKEMAPFLISVDPFAGEGSEQRNIASMKASIKHLRSGGCLIIFPAGEVARYEIGKGISEAPWTAHLGSLVSRTQATVLPISIPGKNGSFFHAAGLIHPRLRTALLLREFEKQQQQHYTLKIGNPIPHSKLKKFSSSEEITQYLRLHCVVMSNVKKSIANQKALPLPQQEVITSSTPQSHINEIQNLLTLNRRLATQGQLSVYSAFSHEIPHLLQEIGRLREITFREVGEGSGNTIDLDSFDRYYEQLLLWDEKNHCLAGGYRLGRADQILREYGSKGLYTSTLFHFEKPFLSSLSRSVEMGRSFITKPYQRNLSSLPLLWKGIARWMFLNPHYNKLFGPVSISKDYNNLSKKFMVEFLQENCLHEQLADYVRPRKPFRYLRTRKLMREFISTNLQDVEDCSALISSVETDGKGLPILLKHYLRLNGAILSFNVDKTFSDVLDGLILVDLTQTDPKLLAKYMGEADSKTYLDQHATNKVTPQK